ncbi:MAG TPA: SDR family oxidoreductase [Thermomicrobiales bacterium]|nr:SDR family oxidoreductase [Thermomicrobiales bacterium]
MESATTGGRLAGKYALVTGSTRGLGRTAAEWLAREGCGIVVHGRAQADVDQAVEEIGALGVHTTGFPADLSKIGDTHRLAEQALGAVPQLDILVNNAGMSIRGRFWEVPDDDWEYQTNVNYRSPFVLAQHAARHMIERGIRGRIVNTSTIGAHLCHTNAAVYDSNKGAVETMTQNMAYELGEHGITVNCVVPGGIPDKPSGNRPAATWGAGFSKWVPLGRAGRSEDTANAVLFFCLPESEWISGQSLMIDGAHSVRLWEG